VARKPRPHNPLLAMGDMAAEDHSGERSTRLHLAVDDHYSSSLATGSASGTGSRRKRLTLFIPHAQRGPPSTSPSLRRSFPIGLSME
jgi:hypothetical protein